MLKACHQVRVPFLWENPQSSYMRRADSARRVLRWPGVQDVITNYCGWGAPWCKPTRFRVFLLPGACDLSKRCRSIRGKCTFSGIKHQSLQGRDGRGVHWIGRAAAYPNVRKSPLFPRPLSLRIPTVDVLRRTDCDLWTLDVWQACWFQLSPIAATAGSSLSIRFPPYADDR
eukprot:7172775-Pyramimonas_sp.AAC.1